MRPLEHLNYAYTMLKGKVILVTGGSGLLGKAIIQDLKSHGAITVNLDINVSKDLSNGEWACDITSEKEVVDAVSAIRQYFSKIDGLVNNAYPRTKDWGVSFEEIPVESWKKNVDWQLNSYFVISQAVLKIMKEAGSGSIIMIASIYGVVGNDFTVYENTSINPPAAYAAIKGGLINFAKYLASFYGRFGIRVNCVSPGGIFDSQPDAFVTAYEKKVPLKRMGNPEDIAPSVSFLLSENAKYITGHNLVVDGGWTII
jgi:NAD(P)-dependent dehydrogenase (short-subunit alcohol dehydrogenase family)